MVPDVSDPGFLSASCVIEFTCIAELAFSGIPASVTRRACCLPELVRAKLGSRETPCNVSLSALRRKSLIELRSGTLDLGSSTVG